MPRNNPSGADNQQGRLLKTDLAWLAGHFDGDGWIGLSRVARNTHPGQTRYVAGMVCVSTSARNINRISEVLHAMQVKHYLVENKPKVGSDGSYRKRKWQISVVSHREVTKALKLLLPFLAEKRPQAQAVLDYLNWRLKQPRSPGGKKGERTPGMVDRAEATITFLKSDRNREEPSETARLAS